MPFSHHLTGGPGAPRQRFGPVRILLILAQLVTAAGFFIAMGGLSKLQKTANGLPLTSTTPLTAAYIEVMQSAGIPPYPTDGKEQFGFFWFLLFLELCILVWILIMCLFPATIIRLKNSAGYLLTYNMALFTIVVRSLTFLHRNTAAKQVFGAKPINVTFAGVIIVLCANGITLVMLGLIGTSPEFMAHASRDPAVGTAGTKQVGPDVAEAPTRV